LRTYLNIWFGSSHCQGVTDTDGFEERVGISHLWTNQTNQTNMNVKMNGENCRSVNILAVIDNAAGKLLQNLAGIE
jgi:hypothetical protein